MSRTPGPKQALFAQLAIMARALGSGTRLESLDFLAQGERGVEALAAVSRLSIAVEFHVIARAMIGSGQHERQHSVRS